MLHAPQRRRQAVVAGPRTSRPYGEAPSREDVHSQSNCIPARPATTTSIAAPSSREHQPGPGGSGPRLLTPPKLLDRPAALPLHVHRPWNFGVPARTAVHRKLPPLPGTVGICRSAAFKSERERSGRRRWQFDPPKFSAPPPLPFLPAHAARFATQPPAQSPILKPPLHLPVPSAISRHPAHQPRAPSVTALSTPQTLCIKVGALRAKIRHSP